MFARLVDRARGVARSIASGAFVVALAVAALVPQPADAGRLTGRSTSGGGGGGSSYTWYTALDKSTVTFTSAGAWGSALAVQEAAAPSAPTPVTATTSSGLDAAMLAGSRTITISGTVDCGWTQIADGAITDVDIIIPPGAVLRSCIFGAAHTNTRVRFRGNTVGSHSGGKLHHVVFWGVWNDLIFDGIDITGPARTGGTDHQAALLFENSEASTGSRLAITNVRGIAGNYFFIGGHAHIIVTGSSIYSGAEAVAEGNPGREGWAFRLTQTADGGIIFFRNDIRGTRYHRIRSHPTSTTGYLWIKDNYFEDRGESQIVAVDTNMTGSTPKGYMAAMWFESNEFWMTGGGCQWKSGSTDPTPAWSVYVRSLNNIGHSDTCTSDASFVTTGSTDVSKSGNTYGALTASPSWKTSTPGDPTGISWNIGQ